MQQLGDKHEMVGAHILIAGRGGHHWSPRWRRPCRYWALML